MTYLVDEELLLNMVTNQGANISELSFQQPVMLVFLRHFGCTFCREALSDLANQRHTIEQLGTKLVLVHMSPNEVAERYFNRYDLPDVEHVSDPRCDFYAAFGLTKGNFNQLFGLSNWIRGFDAAILQRHGVGTGQIGDGFQMPGVFIIQENKIEESFIHKTSSSRPDYLELLTKCCDISPQQEV